MFSFSKFTFVFCIIFILQSQILVTNQQTIECNKSDPDYVDYKSFPNYVQNPDLDGENNDKCSYAGYNTINDHKFFYWYFPSQSKLSINQIPVVLFINGPLGQTVLYPLFSEFGDFTIKQNSVGESYFTERVLSWTRFMSVVYVEMYPSSGLNPQDQKIDYTDLQNDLNSVIKFYRNKFPQQQVSLYTRDFGAKMAIQEKTTSAINNIILDHPLINVQASLKNMLYGSVGIGTMSLNSIEIYNTLIKKCQQEIQNKSQEQYNKCFEKFQDLIINQSQLNPQDSRFDIYNSIYNDVPDIESYMNENLAEISQVLNLDGFENDDFLVVDGETINNYAQYYGVDNTKDFAKASKQVNIQILYGQFNLMNGPQVGFQTISEVFGFNSTNFPTRKLYSTGIMVSGGVESGEKMGYYYQIPNYNYNLNLFSIKQGYSQNTWLEQATELIYNMATVQNDYCYTYYQRTCDMTQTREQFFQQCSQYGQWNQTQNICQCKTGYTGSDCSQVINQVDLKKQNKIQIAPREWYYLQLNAESAYVLLQIHDQIDQLKDINYNEIELGGLQIFVSQQGIIDDLWNTVSGKSQTLDGDYQTYSLSRFLGQNSLILKNPSYPYIAIGNSDYHHTYDLDIQQLTIQPVSDFWDSVALEVINIVMFIFSILLFIIGGYFLKQNSDLKKQELNEDEDQQTVEEEN